MGASWIGDDEHQDDGHTGPLCLTCLHRPARPGSPYCGPLCRLLHGLRLVR